MCISLLFSMSTFLVFPSFNCYQFLECLFRDSKPLRLCIHTYSLFSLFTQMVAYCRLFYILFLCMCWKNTDNIFNISSRCKVYNSVPLNAFTVSCNHHYFTVYIRNFSSSPTKTLYSLNKNSFFPSPFSFW